VEVLPRRGVRSAFQNAGLNLKSFLGVQRLLPPARVEQLAYMIDGEECGVTPMRVTVLPRSVNVLIPLSKDGEMPCIDKTQLQLDKAQ
jgi:hypothetical protein